jgi:hypothetical protein
MLFFILGLAVSVVCAVHAYRTQQDQFWMWIVLMLPMAGSLAYVFAVVLPAWHAQQRSTRAAEPDQYDVAAARKALERAPSVAGRLKLADSLMANDQPREAAALYAGELSGAFADDPQILNKLAQAQMASGDNDDALATLETLKASGATISRESELARARALAAVGKHDDAITAFQTLLPHYPGEDARGHFANLLLSLGRADEARDVLKEIVKRGEHAPKHLQNRDTNIYKWAESRLAELP